MHVTVRHEKGGMSIKQKTKETLSTFNMASLHLPAPTRSGNKIGPGSNSDNAGVDGIGTSTAIVSNSGGSAPTAATKKYNQVLSYANWCNSALRYSKLHPDEHDLLSNKKSIFVQ